MCAVAGAQVAAAACRNIFAHSQKAAAAAAAAAHDQLLRVQFTLSVQLMQMHDFVTSQMLSFCVTAKNFSLIGGHDDHNDQDHDQCLPRTPTNKAAAASSERKPTSRATTPTAKKQQAAK